LKRNKTFTKKLRTKKKGQLFDWKVKLKRKITPTKRKNDSKLKKKITFHKLGFNGEIENQ
jgi:hypothetical protein